MKKLAETKALDELRKIKNDFRELMKTAYETKAKDCAVCPTRGACCLDEHFVNVHISKLEAVQIRLVLGKLSGAHRTEIYRRAAEAVEKYDLRAPGDTFSRTFACPLYEKTVGCLVHETGKPAACIAHACYDAPEDLPPERLQTAIENQIERLNKKVYATDLTWLPLPVWLDSMNELTDENEREETLEISRERF